MILRRSATYRLISSIEYKIIALRADIRNAFNGRYFSIERKRLKRIIHFLKRTDDLGILYHSDEMELNTKTSPAIIFTRLA